MDIKNIPLLKKSVFHPQWLVFRQETQNAELITSRSRGIVLDIGCAEQGIRQHLSPTCDYIGLDYLDTAESMYGTRPMIFGDGQQLPLDSGCIDTVLLMDVLEHIPDPALVLHEICRVLKPGGKLFLTIPFLYPIHDAPFDFQRLTVYGLRKLIGETELVIEKEICLGSPITTACLLGNISLSKTTLNFWHNRHPAALLFLTLPLLIPFLNILAWLLQKLEIRDDFMAHGYMLMVSR